MQDKGEKKLENLLKKFADLSALYKEQEIEHQDGEIKQQERKMRMQNTKSDLTHVQNEIMAFALRPIGEETPPSMENNPLDNDLFNQDVTLNVLREKIAHLNTRTQLEYLVSNAPAIFKNPPTMDDLSNSLYDVKRGVPSMITATSRSLYETMIKTCILKKMFTAYTDTSLLEQRILPTDWRRSNHMVGFHEWIKEYNMEVVNEVDV